MAAGRLGVSSASLLRAAVAGRVATGWSAL